MTDAELQAASRYAGEALWNCLDNSYRVIRSTKPSRAAHFKRQAKKRQNIRARGKK